MDIIEEIRADCPCCKIAYCPLAEFARHIPERTLVQHKCVEIYKWNLSQQQIRPIGWKEAYLCWAESGLAAKFARFWHPGMNHNQIMDAINHE